MTALAAGLGAGATRYGRTSGWRTVAQTSRCRRRPRLSQRGADSRGDGCLDPGRRARCPVREHDEALSPPSSRSPRLRCHHGTSHTNQGPPRPGRIKWSGRYLPRPAGNVVHEDSPLPGGTRRTAFGSCLHFCGSRLRDREAALRLSGGKTAGYGVKRALAFVVARNRSWARPTIDSNRHASADIAYHDILRCNLSRLAMARRCGSNTPDRGWAP